MTIGILTSFSNLNSSYSLASVVIDQLTALNRAGYKTVLFCLPTFADYDKVPQETEVRKVIPQLFLEPYKNFGVPPTLDKEADLVAQALEKHAQDIDVMLAHDIIFIDCYLPYLLGLKRAKGLKARWLHWVHSAPSQRPNLPESSPHWERFKLPQGHKLVYLNHDKLIDLVEMYGAWPKDGRVVHNSLDPRTFFNLSPLIKRIINESSILSADVVSVYPLSTPRMTGGDDGGKQLDKALKVHAKIKKLGYKTCYIIPNAHCTQQRDEVLVQEMLEYARGLGLTADEVVFTSEMGEKSGIKRTDVSDLFRLSNVFIFPTSSENCSLILLEAMLSKNLLVLNSDCSGLKSFGGGSALYFPFGGKGVKREYADEEQFYEDIAKIIMSELKNSRPLLAANKIRQEFNYDSVFKKQLEPLLFEVPIQE